MLFDDIMKAVILLLNQYEMIYDCEPVIVRQVDWISGNTCE